MSVWAPPSPHVIRSIPVGPRTAPRSFPVPVKVPRTLPASATYNKRKIKRSPAILINTKYGRYRRCDIAISRTYDDWKQTTGVSTISYRLQSKQHIFYFFKRLKYRFAYAIREPSVGGKNLHNGFVWLQPSTDSYRCKAFNYYKDVGVLF